MLGIRIVCLSVFLQELCWALGLSVCLFVGWVTYVWHCVCLLFVALMLGIGFVCFLVGDLCLVMVGLFGTSTADCFWNIW